MARAEQLWAAFETFDVILEDASKNYIARQTVSDEGIPCGMIKYRCDGLTLEQWEQWRQDPTALGVAMNDRLTREVLEPDEGHQVVHMMMKMPMIISNRSIITCFYEQEREDGWRTLFHSSQGNEQIVAAR